jgi:hypothetical protein
MVVEYLNAKSKGKNSGVACIYLNHKEAEDQTPVKLLAGFWRQLVFGRDVGPLAKKLYHHHREKCTTPSLSEVYDMLRSAIGGYSKVYLIVDAVDEYPGPQRRTLLQRLAEMAPTVNLMITSRPHISTGPSSLQNIETLEIRATEEDVRRYVDAQIEFWPDLSKHVHSRPELREEIHSKISDTIDGM